MENERWFYRTEAEWNAFAERLPLTACPHCQTVGTLIRHGTLTGFDEGGPPRRTVRARRVLCSNRHRRPGCGRTVSVWVSQAIRRLGVSTRALWGFLRRAAAGPLAAAFRATAGPFSDRTLRRFWTRFDRVQSLLRAALFARCPPPLARPPDPGPPTPAAEVLSHLFAAFPNTDDPIAAYQQATGSFFV